MQTTASHVKPHARKDSKKLARSSYWFNRCQAGEPKGELLNSLILDQQTDELLQVEECDILKEEYACLGYNSPLRAA